MSEGSPGAGLFRRLAPILIAVAVVLFGVNFWLEGAGGGDNRSKPADGPQDGGPPGAGPDQIGFSPDPGAYLLEVTAAGEAPRRIGLDIRKLDKKSYRITRTYQPPEPTFTELPEILEPHLGRILVRIDVGTGGHILDVTGPDDYYDQLDEKQAGMSDPIRALLLEEQIDAHMAWQITPVVSQPALAGRSWTHEAEFRGFGDEPGWSGVLLYSMGEPSPCGPVSPEERCVAVTIDTQSSSGDERLAGTLWLGEESGLQWSSELIRSRGGERRRVKTRLSRR